MQVDDSHRQRKMTKEVSAIDSGNELMVTNREDKENRRQENCRNLEKAWETMGPFSFLMKSYETASELYFNLFAQNTWNYLHPNQSSNCRN